VDFLIDIGNILTFLYFLLCFALAGFALMAVFWIIAIYVYWQEYRESRKAKKLTQQEYIDLLDGDS
jgi:predicted membrane protein